MALIVCHECGNNVSTQAEKCPHCGAKVKKPMSMIDKIFAGFFILLVIYLVNTCTSNEIKSSSPINSDVDNELCETPACIADRNMGLAAGPCEREITKQSKYQAEWTKSMLKPIFKSYMVDEKTGLISYFGDQVRFQNGFGAFANMIYMCRFDPETASVTRVSVEEGRLD